MSEQLRVLPSSNLEQAARSCPLLDDQASREEWVECCTRRFLGVARRVAGGDALAEEVLQEAWLRVLMHVCEYRGGSPACSWVGTIVANCAKDYRAREDRERNVAPARAPSADPGLDPEVRVQQRELLALLYAIVDELPRRSQEVYAMRYVEGLSPAETASRLGISESAVGSRLNRAVGMMKKSLADRIHRQEAKLEAARSAGRAESAGPSGRSSAGAPTSRHSPST